MACGVAKQDKEKQTSKQKNSARLSMGKWLEPQKAQQQAGWGAGEITAKSHQTVISLDRPLQKTPKPNSNFLEGLCNIDDNSHDWVWNIVSPFPAASGL